MRGVVPVGITDGGMGGLTMDGAVDPQFSGNPTWAKGGLQGVNQVVLNKGQIPAHTHANVASSTISPVSHNHGYTGKTGTGYPDGSGDRTTSGVANSYPVTSQKKEVIFSVETTLTNSSIGGGLAHLNVQPSVGCYYIIYIP
jgi:microcystin-dependent protein